VLSAIFAGGPTAINGIRSLGDDEASGSVPDGVVRTALGLSSFATGRLGAIGRIGSVGVMGADIAGGIYNGLQSHMAENAQRGQRAQQIVAAVPSGAPTGSPMGARATAQGTPPGDRLAQILAAIPGGAAAPGGRPAAREVPNAGGDVGGRAYQRPGDIEQIAAGPITRAAQRAAMSDFGETQVERLQSMAGREAVAQPSIDEARSWVSAGAAGGFEFPSAIDVAQEVEDRNRSREAEANRTAAEAEERARGDVNAAQELATTSAARNRARIEQLLQAFDAEDSGVRR
jgi:hypothetical protein